MPKMARRTSARSSASRDQASSPPKPSSDRQSQSPRRTRSGRNRSQSVDLGGDDREPNQNPPAKSRTRQGRPKSVDSDASVALNLREGRTGKPSRTKSRNLSTVAEDREEDEADVEAVGHDGESSEIEDAPNGPRRISSSASQMSGTTAFSAGTSYSAKEVASIDLLAAEKLPELYTISQHILDLLAPPNASENQVKSIARDLKISGSKRAKTLKEEEDKYKGVRALYGSDFDTYIQMRFISRKLLGNQTPKEGLFRPDAVIYTANVAAMVKEFLVFEQGSPTIRQALMDLENFPQPFLRSFNNHVQYGSSALFHESFEMILDIRTQSTITALRYAREQDEFDPEELLMAQFFDEPAERSQELSYFYDVFKNGGAKGLPGGPKVSEEQITRIKERVMEIRSTFRDIEGAQAGDLVDFEQLEEMFPWLDFLKQLVNWSRERLDETSQSIEQQGGLENITKELMHLIDSNNSQSEIIRIPAPAAKQPPQLKPAAEISQLNLNTEEMVRYLQKLKRSSSSLEVASSNPQIKRPRLGGKKTLSRAPDSDTFSEFMLPDVGDENDEILPRHSSSRPTAQYTAIVEAYSQERNKENRPGTQVSARQAGVKGPGKGASTQDRRANAETLQRGGHESTAGPSTEKSSHRAIEEEELSEDEGFEADKRAPDQTRREGLPPPTVTANKRPPKRAQASIEDAEEGQDSSRPHGRSRAIHRPSPRPVHDEDEEGEDGDQEDGTPRPTFRQINRMALSQTAKSRIPASATQKRIPWSDEDVQYLTEGIEEYGCKWSLLWKLDGWEVKRDQVALKDKGRNLVVSYHKAGVPLPANFEQIAIGKKEIAAIQKARPEWEPTN